MKNPKDIKHNTKRQFGYSDFGARDFLIAREQRLKKLNLPPCSSCGSELVETMGKKDPISGVACPLIHCPNGCSERDTQELIDAFEQARELRNMGK